MLLVKRDQSRWRRCWIKLHKCNLHFFENRDELLPFEVISLSGYALSYPPTTQSPVGQVRFRFTLHSQEKGSIHFLADTELDGRLWVKRFTEACTSGNMETFEKSPTSILRKQGDFFDGCDQNSNDVMHSDASDSPTESPLLQQKRNMIHKKYQQANETEEMNAIKRSMILNQRRMSAQTKLDALDKQLLAQQRAKKAKNKKGKKVEAIGDEYDASVKQLINELKQKVKDIEKNLNENIMMTDQKRHALLRKQEMELEILQQEKELMKYRNKAQAALKSMMLKSIIQRLPSPLSEEREFEQDSPDLAGHPPGSTNGSYGQLDKQKGNSNSISSSMSSLSSSSTTDSSGSLHSNPRNSPRAGRLLCHSNESVNSNQVLPQVSGTKQPIRKSPNGSPEMRATFGKIPEPESDSDSMEAIPVSDMKSQLRTEVPPEVLRDIHEFEVMAKLALQKAGWLPSSDIL